MAAFRLLWRDADRAWPDARRWSRRSREDAQLPHWVSSGYVVRHRERADRLPDATGAATSLPGDTPARYTNPHRVWTKRRARPRNLRCWRLLRRRDQSPADWAAARLDTRRTGRGDWRGSRAQRLG